MLGSVDFKAKSFILDTSFFRKVYMVTLFFEMIAFFDVVALAVRCIVLTWASLILSRNFFINKKVFDIKYINLLTGFIISGIFTVFCNLSTDFLANLVFIYHSIVCFVIFYGMSKEKDHDFLEKEMVFLFKVFAALSTFFAILSITVLVFKAQVTIGPYYLGIFRSRLIGVYTNQNLLAFSMVVSIVSCDILKDKYIRKKYKNKSFSPIFSVFCVIVNFLALFLSDSNASFLFIIIYFTAKIFYKSLAAYSNIKPGQLIREGSCLIVCCATMVAGSFVARNTCQNMISLFVDDIHKIEEPITDDGPVQVPNQPAVNKYIPDISIGRENYDVSSGRITLFKQGLELFCINPILGIGRGNLVAYGEKYLDGGLIFSDLHNSYLTILVSYGAVGFFIFFSFGLLLARSVCKYMFRSVHVPGSSVSSKLFSMLVAYCAYSLFEKAILSEITFMVVIFWLVLGYIMSYKEYVEKTYGIYED